VDFGKSQTVDCRLTTDDFRLKPQERSDANYRQTAACPYSFQLPASDKAAQQRLKAAFAIHISFY